MSAGSRAESPDIGGKHGKRKNGGGFGFWSRLGDPAKTVTEVDLEQRRWASIPDTFQG